jgi:hypothetical protein
MLKSEKRGPNYPSPGEKFAGRAFFANHDSRVANPSLPRIYRENSGLG